MISIKADMIFDQVLDCDFSRIYKSFHQFTCAYSLGKPVQKASINAGKIDFHNK
jgi:hypothetical protein